MIIVFINELFKKQIYNFKKFRDFWCFFFISNEMKIKNKKIILTILLIGTLGNYARMHDTENVRTVVFLSIFAIGAISSLLVSEIFGKDKEDEE